MKKPILQILNKMLPLCATVLKLVQKKAAPLKSIPNSIVKNPYSLIQCGASVNTQSFRASHTFSTECKVKKSPAKFGKKRRKSLLNDIILNRSCGVRPSMTDSFRAWHLQHGDGHRNGKRNRHHRLDSSNAPIQPEDPRYGFEYGNYNDGVSSTGYEDCWWNDFQFSDIGSECEYAVSREGEQTEGQDVVISGQYGRREMKISPTGRRKMDSSLTGSLEIPKSTPLSQDMVNSITDSSFEARHSVDRRTESRYMPDLGAESIIVPETIAGFLDEHDKKNVHDTKRRKKATASCNMAENNETSKMMSMFPETRAMAKLSLDPCTDFASSMTEMIMAHGIAESQELVDLFRCYLRLNSPSHHSSIAVAFVTALAAMDAACRQRDEFFER